MTNSIDQNFVDQAISSQLQNKDKLQIAAAAISSSLIGTIVERTADYYKKKDGTFQHDKILHANIGAIINLGGVAGAYLAIETAGVGDKLELTRTQKKWAILLTGTFLGLLAGYGKERFYDYYHQDSHTYDPHLKGDMGATCLGGGILNAATGAVIFQF